jgi:hypothetical protein
MAITPAYLMPPTVASATPPTAAQMSPLNEVYATLTGDGSATSIILVHNMHVSTADLLLGLPEVFLEPLLAAFYTEHPIVTLKTADNVTITVAGSASSAFAGVRIKRPHTNSR